MTRLTQSAEPAVTRQQVLMVCTGNICRSPVAERLLHLALEGGSRVGSAGTAALRDQPMAPEMAALLQSSGADPVGFRARQLTPQLLAEARVVLTMTRQHRAQAVELLPSAVQRSFTLVEFARLLGAVPADRLPQAPIDDPWSAVVPLAAAQRGQTSARGAGHAVPPAVDDIDDPYGRPQHAYTNAFEHISRAVSSIVQVMHPLVGVTGWV